MRKKKRNEVTREYEKVAIKEMSVYGKVGKWEMGNGEIVVFETRMQ